LRVIAEVGMNQIQGLGAREAFLLEALLIDKIQDFIKSP
jgi:hypothetical protein